MPADAVTFRPLVEGDLPRMHLWLNEPGIVRWWEGDDVSWDGVVRQYHPDHWEDEEQFVAAVDGVDVGWIQCYPAAADPEETLLWRTVGVDVDRTGGIDYFVAEPSARGRGLGSRIIRAFTVDVVFGGHPAWHFAAAGPFVANEASWRALGRAGYAHAGDVDGGDADGPCRVMVLARADVDRAG